MELTQEYLKTVLHYNPETGILTWKRRPREHFRTARGWNVFNTQCAGKEAGNLALGYTKIGIDSKNYQAHRLVYLYNYGTLPEEIDHINGIRDDNRLENLRPVTHSENMKNARKSRRNTSGFVGVHWNRDNNKWRAKIKAKGQHICLGCFDSLLDAVAARMRANKKYGFSDRHGGVALYPKKQQF